MSRSVDERVVEMQFDNKQFESGIKTSMKSLENLKKGLNFDAATKSLSNIEKATRNFSVAGIEKGVDLISSKFTNLGIVGVTALQRITNEAITAGTQLVKSLSLDPVMQGFQEYELQMGSIQTILANTQSKGSTLNDEKYWYVYCGRRRSGYFRCVYQRFGQLSSSFRLEFSPGSNCYVPVVPGNRGW